MKFWKKESREEEKKEEQMKNFTLKMKQDRYGNWICESARVQGDSIDEIKERMDLLIDAVIDLDWTRKMWKDKEDDFFIKPDSIADEAWHLSHQEKSAWTFETTVRPFGESW